MCGNRFGGFELPPEGLDLDDLAGRCEGLAEFFRVPAAARRARREERDYAG
jgi:hypothetical protein